MNRKAWSHPQVQKPVIAVLVGPTAVGKTEVSLQLAARLDAEIVSADSRLFYRGMDIGTAKPSQGDQRRVPHHLIDIVEPDQTLSVAVFQQLAHDAITGIRSRGRLPLLVGGTGQYVRAVISGWSPPSVQPHQRLRAALQRIVEEEGGLWLHNRLQRLDPEAGASIDARNVRRTIRAMEVILTTGRRFSEQRLRGESRYRPITVGLKRPRAALYARIDRRIDEMWKEGLLEETKRLLDQGFSPDLPAMSAIGYSQCARVLRGDLEEEQAKVEMRRATRAFVRRQSNWFKESDPKIVWFDAGQDSVIDQIEAFVRHALVR